MLTSLLQFVGLQRAAGSTASNTGSRTVLLLSLSAAAYLYYRKQQQRKAASAAASPTALTLRDSNSTSLTTADGKKRRVAVNAEFFRRLRVLLRIVLPGVRCKEFGILALHTLFLVSRTLVSIYVAKLDGSIVKSIVDRQMNTFIWLMAKWMLIAIPATYINSM